MAEKSQSSKTEKSCRLIKDHDGNEMLSLHSISKEDILKAVQNFPSKKTCISNDIPAEIIKNFSNCYCEKLKDINAYRKISFHI